MRRTALLLALALAAATPAAPAPAGAETIRSERAAFRIATFAEGLERPWGGAFLPDGRLILTERPGRIRLIGRDGRVSAPLGGVPEVRARGQGGLLDIALAPDFAATREIYLCHAAAVPDGVLTRLVRARLAEDGSAIEAARPILDATPAQSRGNNHFGCRIAFGPADGKLYLTTGDRFAMQRAQALDDLAGKVLRLERDGRPAEGNPWPDRAGVRPEIWSYGHRNPQSLAFHPATGALWEAEFGPLGGDELNIIRRGENYGWPAVTFGRNYDGSIISPRTEAPGVTDPVRSWTPVISPSGMAFYGGEAFPGWRGSLFLAGLRPPGLVRLTLEGERVTGEERLLQGLARLRNVIAGPDGLLYLLTDEVRGRVLRLEPAE